MDPKISAYLTAQRLSCLTVVLKDGSPHASTLHFSHNENPWELYFSTENTSKKCEGLLNGETVKASCVLGFSEEEFKTLQMDGEVKMITDSQELSKIKDIHYAKHPSSKKYENEPETVFLKFTPKWWRYTDYTTTPLTKLSSE
jgi:general stress protein 26